MAMTDRWFIYVLRDPRTNEIRYVGKAADPARRLRAHCYGVRRQAHRYTARWIRSLKALGLKPSMTVIDAGNGDGHGAAERAWIAEFHRRGARLTNHTPGGDGGGGPHSEETREKIRRAKAANPWRPSQESRERMAAAQRGRKMSPEAIEKSASKRRGQTYGPETHARMSAAGRTKKFSEEHRRNLSEAGKGRTLSPEIREKVAASKRGKPRPDVAARMRGRVVSEETRAKLSAAHSGKRISSDHAAKIRAGLNAYQARKRAEKEASTNGEPEEGSG